MSRVKSLQGDSNKKDTVCHRCVWLSYTIVCYSYMYLIVNPSLGLISIHSTLDDPLANTFPVLLVVSTYIMAIFLTSFI